jgi:hypothetical protein
MACTPISLSAWIEAKLKAAKALAQRLRPSNRVCPLLRDLVAERDRRRDLAERCTRYVEEHAAKQESEERNCHHMSSLTHDALFFAYMTSNRTRYDLDAYHRAGHAVSHPAVPPFA